MSEEVILASVPTEHLASFLTIPSLAERVAFGSTSMQIKTLPLGATVYIHASKTGLLGPHPLYIPGKVGWAGQLDRITAAVEHGSRSGKHRDASLRPPTAEQNDGPFALFWEICGLHQLSHPLPFSAFESRYRGEVPEWPVIAALRNI